MELLTKEDQSLIAMTLREGVSDRGSHCLERDEQVVIFHQISNDLVLQAGHTPENSPSWLVQVFRADEAELLEKIKALLAEDWTLTKTQFDDLVAEIE